MSWRSAFWRIARKGLSSQDFIVAGRQLVANATRYSRVASVSVGLSRNAVARATAVSGPSVLSYGVALCQGSMVPLHTPGCDVAYTAMSKRARQREVSSHA